MGIYGQKGPIGHRETHRERPLIADSREDGLQPLDSRPNLRLNKLRFVNGALHMRQNQTARENQDRVLIGQ